METQYLATSDINLILDQVYDWSHKQNYRGYNKHDGLNSPVLNTLLGWSKWPRLIAIQGVMRFPVNIRPLLFIPKTYNPKGLALFTMGLLDRYSTTKDKRHLIEAEQLLKLLLEIKSPGNWSGICWGYHYPWRDPGFFAPTNTPNAVVTCFVCEAFLQAYRITGKQAYLDIVESAINFMLGDLTVLKNNSLELCLSYMPLPMTMRVMDVSILIGAVISQHATLARTSIHSESAHKLVQYVIRQQTNEGAWFYTDPPSDSHIRHDNYHTGFILDALQRYMDASNNYDWQKQYNNGLLFYANQLFNKNGSPRWMSDTDFPHDIHGAAQGILTFSRHLNEYSALVKNIYTWSLQNMYNTKGYFYYQETRYYTKKFNLLRWCNAWMAHALSRLTTTLEQ